MGAAREQVRNQRDNMQVDQPAVDHLFGCGGQFAAEASKRLELEALRLKVGTKEMMQPLSSPPACHLFGCG